MKKRLLSFFLLLLPLVASAAIEPYAVLSSDGKTVTFYYDENKASRGGIDINNQLLGLSKDSPYGTATTAIIDASFANYWPTSTVYWFCNCSNLTTIKGMENLKTDNVKRMDGMFYNCSGLTSLDVSGFKTDNVTSMSSMFGGCSGLTSLDVSGFKTDNVTYMAAMFYECSGLKSLDVSGFKTENVTNMFNMFYKCSGLTSLDVSGFKTDKVTDMGQMFMYCSGLTSLDVSGFKTDKVTYMRFMFGVCSNLTSLDVSGFNTENVTSMAAMFHNCRALTNLDVSGFKTDNVTDMGEMFYDCPGLTSLDVSGFKTDNVTSMSGMFDGCSGLTSLDVSGFKTDNVTKMSRMFYNCSGLTSLDVSGFKTDNVTSMNAMFAFCSGLTSLDVSGFKTDNVTNMGSMFYGCSALTTIYASEENWSTDKVTSSSYMFSGCPKLVGGNGTKYDASHTDKEYARIDKPGAPGYFTDIKGPQEDLKPIDGGVDFGSEDSVIGEDTDLDGNVVGNVYYNIAPGNGGYNPVEGCIEVTKPTSDEEMDNLAGKDIFGEDVSKHFTGIVFKVPAGSGSITVSAETVGSMVLKVKIGRQEPFEMMLTSKNKVKIPYTVDKPTYVYIYASTMDADASRRQGRAAAGAQPCLKLYGIELAVKKKKGDVNGDGQVDVADIAAVIDRMAAATIPDASASGTADVNGDGQVDVADIAAIIDQMAANARQNKAGEE